MLSLSNFSPSDKNTLMPTFLQNISEMHFLGIAFSSLNDFCLISSTVANRPFMVSSFSEREKCQMVPYLNMVIAVSLRYYF